MHMWWSSASGKQLRKRAAAIFEERERKRVAAAYEERERKRAASNEAILDDIRLKAKRKVNDPFRLNCRGVDKENVLKVFWEKGGLDYSEKRLREIFEKFGEVEDVIMSYAYKGSAHIVMATKDGIDDVAAAVAAGTLCGDILNPLIVKPLFTTSLSM